jgi:hypothetical protein
MNKYLIRGLVVGGVFAATITGVATFDTIADGGFALLASVVFGLSAGLCIGGLIAANFAMLAVDEQPHQTASHAPYAELREAA